MSKQLIARSFIAASLVALASCALAVNRPLEEPRFDGLLDVYAQNRVDGLPNFVTADLLVLGYSLIRENMLAEVERDLYEPLLSEILDGLSVALKGAPASEATDANRDFLAILTALAQGRSLVGNAAADTARAQAELDAVLDAKGVLTSPLWRHALDYTQFVPRGRYAGDSGREAYFRCVRYAGAVVLVVQESAATGISAATADRMITQAVELATLLRSDSKVAAAYQRLNEALTWEFGRSEDLSLEILSVPAETGLDDPTAFRRRLLEEVRRQGRQPTISDAVVDVGRLEEGLTVADVLTGWRLLPSRYRADSAAFQGLVYDGTGQYLGDASADPEPFGLTAVGGKAVKGFPLVDELLALLGSEASASKLRVRGEMAFEGYERAFSRARETLDAAQGLEALHLALLRVWLGRPFQNEEGLDSVRAFWTLQRHAALLYAKQSYTAVGKGLSIPQTRPGAVLEEATPVYEALSEVVAKHREHTPGQMWNAFAAMLERVLDIDRKIGQGEALDAADEAYLNRIDRDLLALTAGPDRPIIVDVHTNPATGEVLQEATAWPRVVHATHSPSRRQARGARLTHREFKQPMDRRLTDQMWRRRLEAGA